VDEFSRIFEMNCRRRQLTFDPVVIEYMIRRYYEPRGIDMRACHPRDIVEQVVDMSRYQGREPSLSRDLIDAACRSYFIERTVETSRPQPRANGTTLRPTPRGTGGHASDAFRGSRGPAN
jgi:hypothetical protein